MDDIRIQLQLGDDETTTWRATGAAPARYRAGLKRTARWLSRQTERPVEIVSTPEYDAQYDDPQRHVLYSSSI